MGIYCTQKVATMSFSCISWWQEQIDESLSKRHGKHTSSSLTAWLQICMKMNSGLLSFVAISLRSLSVISQWLYDISNYWLLCLMLSLQLWASFSSSGKFRAETTMQWALTAATSAKPFMCACCCPHHFHHTTQLKWSASKSIHFLSAKLRSNLQ